MPVWGSSGSVLGPLLFTAYVSLTHPQHQYHQFADDTQLYVNSSQAVSRLSECTVAVKQ